MDDRIIAEEAYYAFRDELAKNGIETSPWDCLSSGDQQGWLRAAAIFRRALTGPYRMHDRCARCEARMCDHIGCRSEGKARFATTLVAGTLFCGDCAKGPLEHVLFPLRVISAGG